MCQQRSVTWKQNERNSTEVVNHHQMLNKEKDEEVIKQADNILEGNKMFHESVDAVCIANNEVKTACAHTLNGWNEGQTKHWSGGFENVTMRQEVKEVIRKKSIITKGDS